MNDPIQSLADACGIAGGYHDIWGGHHPTSDSTRRDLLSAMHVDLSLAPAALLADLPAIPPPAAKGIETAGKRCHQPAALAGGQRLWGVTIQLYGLRSRRNWGIGDFTDLRTLVELTAAAGGALVGLNPLHALFPDDPQHISPYSPSHRGFLNVLYIDVEALPELADCEVARRRVASAEFQQRLQALRNTDLVDYPGVAAVKFDILPLLFAHFQATGGARAEAFSDWRRAQGDTLEYFSRFEALQSHFRGQDEQVWGWPAWPAEFRGADAPAVADFAARHADEVSYRAWLQWLADQQLAAVQQAAVDSGMAIGLYRDLAVGASSGGAEVWQWQKVFAEGASTGAPPDDLNLLGQDWGLPPFVPHRLRDAGYRPFVDVLRANMRHAGALRIDHVMGLARLFWVPADVPATEGAYVAYPFEDLLGRVVGESLAAACLVIGEDLGTVPAGFRERLFEAGVLSYHPLIFERYDDGQFRLPADMPPQALVAAGTHDLPTLAGFWRGIDLDVRTQLHLFPSDEMRHKLVTERDWDRGRLLWALEREGLLPPGVSKDPAVLPDLTLPVIAAIHAFLARSRSPLLVVQPEDIFGVADQINVPGTLEDQHPNWQRKQAVSLEAWAADGRFQEIVAAIRSGR